MSARPITIDCLAFARSGRQLSGRIRLADTERLADILDPSHDAVQYEISGARQGGRPVLRLKIDSAARLQCQRCLEYYRRPLHLEAVLAIARDESELARWEAEDATLDAIVADSSLDVLTLVEDEILLSLPLSPHHPDGECVGTEPA